jgi:RHS repeat-associated protein
VVLQQFQPGDKRLGKFATGQNERWSQANRYRSEYTYDANGNSETVERYDADGTGHYDSFAYHYHTIDGRKQQNRLYELIDDAPMSTGSDIVTTATGFDNTSNGVNVNNNYGYDALGNLVRDDREEIELIHWTVAGKVDSIQRPDASSRSPLKFRYGASGQRVSKQVGDFYCTEPGSYREHYIRDAQGNIMATYRYKLLPVPNTTTQVYEASLKLNERPLYGSSRLGSLRTELELRSLPSFDPTSANPVQQVDLNYELTDHLGNVCAVVTGRLLDGNGGGTPKQAELVSAQGYEAFGSLLPGRNYSSDSYRFGFQGQEKDDEMHGATGTSYAFEYRMHDPRIGRFLSIDPLAASFAYYSPYHFAGNKPTAAVDFEGLEDIYWMDSFKEKSDGSAAIDKLTATEIGKQILSTFQRVTPVGDDPGNQGYDLFVRSTSQYYAQGGYTSTTLDTKGMMRDMEQAPLMGIYPPGQAPTPRFVSVREKLLEARSRKEGVYYEHFVRVLGEEVLMSDGLLSSIENGRKLILVDVNPDFAGGPISRRFSRSGKSAYVTGHEIGAHANRLSRGILTDQKEDHLKWTGQKADHTMEYDGEDTPEGQLLRQIGENEKKP